MSLTDAANGTENCLFLCHREIVCIFSPRVLNLCTFPILASICSRPDMDKSQLFTVGHDKNTTQPKGMLPHADSYKYTFFIYLRNCLQNRFFIHRGFARTGTSLTWNSFPTLPTKYPRPRAF
ncbi:hypothetical protein Zmor_028189 [Zophobas morio]|uniref:Uncharacterized protein n=1 Tax=Zophobas morio TaxID=2755281 RepID=A0AA38M3Y3_9CUCU|nr:hypothetical protein Zmor_028189 [Zophobas morio]